MKTLFNFGVGVIFLYAMMSCQVDETAIGDNMDKDVTFTFYASGAENQTKTIRQDDGSVWWDTNESIKVFCNRVSGKFESDNLEPSATATFTGSFESSITMNDITTNGIMAIYPYQENATYANGKLTFTLPSEQIATKGTFGKELFPCIACSKNTNLSFFNICSGIKFSVVNDDIRSVTFKTSKEEPIAGLVKVDYWHEGMPTVHVQKGVSEVTVYAPDGGYFEPGEFYYITILPPPAPTYYFWDGFTMIYNKDDVSDYITITEKVPLPRSKFGVIEGKDAGLLFIDYDQPIEFADQIMKEQCVTAFDKNGDGELSYAEARSVTDLSKMSLTKRTFKSFDEFQYFSSVRKVPNNYFECSNIKSIVLPQGITHIGWDAFRDCSSLACINIPAGVTEIEVDTFRDCSSLANIVLPEGITRIGSSAFNGCI